MDTKKKMLTITPEMEQALRAVHDDTGIPMARLVRDGIIMVLAKHGHTVKDEVKQGGLRERKEAEQTTA